MMSQAHHHYHYTEARLALANSDGLFVCVACCLCELCDIRMVAARLVSSPSSMCSLRDYDFAGVGKLIVWSAADSLTWTSEGAGNGQVSCVYLTAGKCIELCYTQSVVGWLWTLNCRCRCEVADHVNFSSTSGEQVLVDHHQRVAMKVAARKSRNFLCKCKSSHLFFTCHFHHHNNNCNSWNCNWNCPIVQLLNSHQPISVWDSQLPSILDLAEMQTT